MIQWRLIIEGTANCHRFTVACMYAFVQVKAILVNVFGGIVNCATIANGIVNAAKSIKMNVPVVVRLEGMSQTYFSYIFVFTKCGDLLQCIGYIVFYPRDA